MSALSDKVNQIKSMYAKAMSMLANNKQRLLALQPKLRTQAQKAKFQKLVQAQKAHEDIFRSKIEPTMQQLRKAVAMTQQVVAKVQKAGAAVKQKFISTAQDIWSRVKGKVGLKGLKDIQGIDDIGVIPIVAVGLIAAGLFTALGYLISLAQSQQESIDALNQYVEAQAQAQAQGQEEEQPEYYEETPPEEEA